MNERLLQFIWQFQYFNSQSLLTTEEEILSVEKPGIWNHHQGPDFSEAAIRIGKTRWVGNIELHLRSSDWRKHRHDEDHHYTTIILHVVWEDDQPLHNTYGRRVPTLELRHRIPKVLLDRYEYVMQATTAIPCKSFLPALHELSWLAWKERLAAERLTRKSAQVLDYLQRSGNHWEEISWWMLASNFGVKVNAVLFEEMAKTIPLSILSKHRTQIHQLEALLMGQGNLLTGDFEDSYAIMLQREYRHLKKKYKLASVYKQPAFLRMRPAAFPTIRLSQLAQVLHTTCSFFSKIKEAATMEMIRELFEVDANDYWHYHYRFDEETAFQPKHLGRQMAENILINTVVPVLFAYGVHTHDDMYKNKALQWLQQLDGENNRITAGWKQTGIRNDSAMDSQALIELTNHYCMHKRCLECAVGNRILRNGVL